MMNRSSNKQIFASLLVVILMMAGICGFSLWKYQTQSGSKTQNQMAFGQQNSFANASQPSQSQTGSVEKSGTSAGQNSGSMQGGQQLSKKQGTGGNKQTGKAPSNGLTSEKQQTGSPRPPNRMGGSVMGNQSESAGTVIQKWLLGVYGTLFFIASAALAVLFQKKKFTLRQENYKIIFWTLVSGGLFLRLAVAPWSAGHLDLSLFQNWAQSAASGLTHFYQNSASDYPPLYIYVLYVIGKLALLPELSGDFSWMIKLPAIVCDLATAYYLYRLAKRTGYEKIGMLLMSFYLLNPAILIDSTFWGQVDSFFTLIIVLAVTCLVEKRLYLATIFFATAVMMKPQGIIFLPVLVYVFIKERKFMQSLVSVGLYLAVTVLIALPFSFHASGGALWLVNLLQRTISEYPFASVNAYNFFSLIGANYRADTSTLLVFSYHTWGMLAIVLVTLGSCWLFIRKKDAGTASIAALLQIAGVFTFASGMHERYLYPAIALALVAFLYRRDRRYFWLAVGFSVTNFINIFTVYYDSLNGVMTVPYQTVEIVTSALNVLLFIYLIWASMTARKQATILSLKLGAQSSETGS